MYFAEVYIFGGGTVLPNMVDKYKTVEIKNI